MAHGVHLLRIERDVTEMFTHHRYNYSLFLFRDFLPWSRYISQTIQDSAIVTMEGE